MANMQKMCKNGKTVEPAGSQQSTLQCDAVPPTRAAREELAIQETRRQQLAEKKADLAAKEEELKKLGLKDQVGQ